jgi:hypothetical protein
MLLVVTRGYICKVDVTSVFIKFQVYVERFFDSRIKSVQSNWGGEYHPSQQIIAIPRHLSSHILPSHAPTKWCD